jgi:hypothetical protein
MRRLVSVARSDQVRALSPDDAASFVVHALVTTRGSEDTLATRNESARANGCSANRARSACEGMNTPG